MPRKKYSKKETASISSHPTHVVALYDYVPGQSDINVGDTWAIQAPHLDTHLSFLKGETFKVIGDVDWWLYVNSNDGKTGYIPSILTAPLNTDCLNTEQCKVLSHHGDVPSCAIDTQVDLTYFPDTPLDRDTQIHQRKESPEEKANIFSMLTFWWMTQLVWLGFRRPLISKDLWCLKGSLWSQNIGSKFDKHWKEEKERVLRKLERHQSGKMTSVANGRTSSATDERQNLNDEVKYSSDERKEYHPSLIKTLWKVFGRSLIPAFFLKLCCDTLTFVQPQLLGAIIEFIDDRDQRELWEGILYAGGMFVVALFQTLVLQQYFKIVMITGLSIRTAVLGIVYRKALVLSTVSRNQSTVGEMVNLMSVDAQRLMDILTYINMLWSAPYQISLAIFFLYRTMGISVLAGVAVMLVLFPLNFFIGRRMRKFQ